MKTFEQFIREAEAHPGFDKVADKIAQKDDVSKAAADAILAAATRKDKRIKSDVKRNPRLKRVKG